ncbi:MAG: hypothetical protein H5T61_06405 [Thermoflexales bacterium]|nr:hypothetical protein [Thermoflexales bacterium]
MSPLSTQTVSDMIALLLQAEIAAQTLYLRLMEAFAHEPDASRVWWKMGADEAAHIRLLEQIRDSLPPDRLQAPADPIWLEQAKSAARFSPERVMARIQTLEDAYQEAHAIENSEINAVFEFVMTEYFPRPLRLEFIHNMLREHVDRLNDLRTTDWRRSILKASG